MVGVEKWLPNENLLSLGNQLMFLKPGIMLLMLTTDGIDDCNLHEEDGGCTKVPLLPTTHDMAINLVCVVSTMQGCRPLLEKEIKTPQEIKCLPPKGSREDGNFCQFTG